MIRRPLAAAALALCGVGAVACGGAAVSDTGASDAGASATTAQIERPAATQKHASDATGQAATGPADSEMDITTVPGTRTAALSDATAKPLAGKTVVIDPGHNGGNYRHTKEINRLVNISNQKKACDTTGTSTNDGYTEAAFTWDVSNKLAKLLKARGATVKLTRSRHTEWGPCIDQRAAIGNKANADAAISIHGDGAAAHLRGFHIIMPKKIGGPVDAVVDDSARLGKAVRDAFRRGTGLPYSNYIGRQALNYRSDLGGLNLSRVPKIFIECGNMRNPTDAAKFKDRKFRQRMAKALADGLENYLLATH
ncbi:N-acetylmuramoyl-L-alanine amidase [Microbispora rosea subsp. aerata]|nr:N-acetylmuramoyl-L-alanine amidase [Microbispora rosea]GGO16272.1 N-acetylmuramoyl-L-alanine amidase [Microbispora rosea subsp. aerata]GIH55888.1 N-acetylmuramoyl-L-alanine amidase [Microbispora rosea subsp. aerata]GLJ83198.1 N-acetylmuramoyl-L-alanine amidase [Microbispora rosea subsp. aerata]